MTDTDHNLPIDALRDEFVSALDDGHVVVTAATGTGKSTRLPVWAAALGRVLVVEPRRIAAISLAGFVAESIGAEPGGRVGHAVRLDAHYSDGSEIVFVTPGMALNWHADGRLDAFDTVVLDEFHERRWDTDLLLAMLRSAGRHRLVLTSATIEGERLAGELGARHLRAEGRSFPVSVRHPASDKRAMPTGRGLSERVAEAVRNSLEEGDGDVLVFLPGRGEIRAAAGKLRDVPAEIVELHGGASADQQRRALRRGAGRRVILATNVAETSLTVPDVTTVVDSGLERRTTQRNGRTVLTLAPIALANADQRKGRAGRVASGRCLRLWGEHAPMQKITPPEVRREELTDLVLAAAVAGYRADELPFPDALPAPALERARRMLHELDALDERGLANERGRALFALPIDTVLAHLVLAMPDEETGGFMADLVAALSVRDRLVTAPEEPDARDRLTEWLGRRCDATLRVAALRLENVPECRIPARARAEARRLAEQIRALAGLPGRPDRIDPQVPARATRAAARAAPALAFVRREKRREAMGNGRSETVVGEHSLFGPKDEAAVVFDDHSVPGKGTRKTVTIGTCLAPLRLRELVDTGLAEPEIARPDWVDGRLIVQRRWRHADRVVLEDETEPDGDAAREALARLILENRLLKPAGRRLQEDIDAWDLYVRLGHAEGEVPEPGRWLRKKLAELGVGHAGDMALIEPEDLRFDGVPEWERERFDEKYPRRVSLTDLDMRIHYEPRKKLVTAEHVGGIRKKPPRRWELPAWSGWRIRFKQASRVVEIR